MTIVKVCKIHGELKLEEVIYKNENNMRCKECHKESVRKSHDKNREEKNAKQRDRRKNDLEYREQKLIKDREYKRKEYAERKEKVLARNKSWRDRNPEKQKSIAYKTKYGITLEEYQQLFKLQNGVCKICKEPESSLDNFGKEGKVLSVDHCHNSKAVRGLLCNRCNFMIGYARDSEDILEAGKVYLREFKNGISESCSQKKC